MDHPVDGRRRGHGVGEDVLPLGEDQVGRDARGPAFVAFGDEGEEHLGLLRALGQVSHEYAGRKRDDDNSIHYKQTEPAAPSTPSLPTPVTSPLPLFYCHQSSRQWYTIPPPQLSMVSIKVLANWSA